MTRRLMPQYGINRAGVVYEAPVEGGHEPLYVHDRGLSTIWSALAPCAAAGPTTPILPREFDAIYAHYGQSTFAKPYLNNVDNINGLEGIGTVAYYRTSDRKQPHNAYTSGTASAAVHREAGVFPGIMTRPTRATISLRETG